ncbi:MAG: hypothetical protein PHP98_02225 [Kiritimatiellae bacterium]|jgi:GNAT superfamily N-acetyltransferase|nr:hypothetical protein [Kiritimatiellia bacterium]
MRFELKQEHFPPPDGALLYARIPWDSELFGFPFYELLCGETPPEKIQNHLRTWLAALPPGGPCLAFARLSPQDVALGRVLTNAGFYPVETTLSFKMPFRRFTPVMRRAAVANMVFRRAEEADLPFVVDIARHAFAADRFHLDSNLPPGPADERYARWVERGFRAGELVYLMQDERNGRIMTFIHGRALSSAALEMSLGAVVRDSQNSGIGVATYQFMLAECKTLGFKTVETVASINNMNILKLLLRLGYMLENARMTYHWYRPA